MSIIINWVEQSEEKEIPCCTICKISLLVGDLIVYRVKNVIIKTQWSLLSMASFPSSNERQCITLQDCLNNPTKPLIVNLQKQGSAFRNIVWAEICRIPIGQVLSYSALAKKVGSGARAVANACRDNPFPAIVPCHRVVAVTGLGGYMGETTGKCMDIKKKLLKMEANIVMG